MTHSNEENGLKRKREKCQNQGGQKGENIERKMSMGKVYGYGLKLQIIGCRVFCRLIDSANKIVNKIIITRGFVTEYLLLLRLYI